MAKTYHCSECNIAFRSRVKTVWPIMCPLCQFSLWLEYFAMNQLGKLPNG